MARLNATIFWMGLTDEISEGRWIWRDTGLEPTYTGWSPGEPNSFQGENEDCSIFYVTTNYAWADASCLGKFPPCCEIDLSNSGGVVG
ncbi:hepatic lectin-like [Mya arenaria]|nr:hepatic lectin-like [Mya arenaria]